MRFAISGVLCRLAHRYDVYVATDGWIEYVLHQGFGAVDTYLAEARSIGFDVPVGYRRGRACRGGRAMRSGVVSRAESCLKVGADCIMSALRNLGDEEHLGTNRDLRPDPE